MGDKILQTKKEMKRIINSKGITRLERYNLAKEKCNVLSEIERKLLIKECRRDYESYDRSKDITELIIIFMTGLGLILTLLEAVADDAVLGISAFVSMGTFLVIYIALAILAVAWLQTYRSGNMNMIKYMLDILEDYSTSTVEDNQCKTKLESN